MLENNIITSDVFNEREKSLLKASPPHAYIYKHERNTLENIRNQGKLQRLDNELIGLFLSLFDFL